MHYRKFIVDLITFLAGHPINIIIILYYIAASSRRHTIIKLIWIRIVLLQ